MDVMEEELKRGLEAAYQLHMELTQRLIEKEQHKNEELMASMDHHIAVILQTFQNCIARLTNPNIQDPSIANTIPADDVECFDIGRIRQLQPMVITTDLKEDGFKWRKYGKKPILSSKYPREYYKCRYTENGCRALKYVQMICDSPARYKVVYSGSHTCKNFLGDLPEMLSFCGSSKSSNLEPEPRRIISDVQTIPSWPEQHKTIQEEKLPIARNNDAYSSPTSQDLMAMGRRISSPSMSRSNSAEIDYSYFIDENMEALHTNEFLN